MTKEKEKKLYLALIALFAAAAVLVVIFTLAGRKNRAAQEQEQVAQELQEDRQEKKIITVEKEITARILQDGLNDMGQLVTEEYYFTEVTEFSSIKKLFNTIDLKFTESSYLAGYDGVVTAGIDFAAIQVKKDEAAAKITVHLPRAEILNVDIDPDSFVLYAEKTGIGNPLSVADYNQSMVELENTAREKALEKGVLTRAEENAKQLVGQFVAGLVDTDVYVLEFAVK